MLHSLLVKTLAQQLMALSSATSSMCALAGSIPHSPLLCMHSGLCYGAMFVAVDAGHVYNAKRQRLYLRLWHGVYECAKIR